MNIFDKGFQWIAEQNKIAKENEQFFAGQRRQKLMLDRHWTQYWLVDLAVDEAVDTNLGLLQVQKPSIPKLLMPADYKVKIVDKFPFEFKRNPNNTPCSINPTLPHEVVRIVTDHLTMCRFSNFKVLCTEDTYKYYVTVCALGGFYIGRPILSNCGELFRDYKSDMLGIRFFDGSGYNLIRANTAFKVYYCGQWVNTGILFNEYSKPYLARFNTDPFNAVGYIAKI